MKKFIITVDDDMKNPVIVEQNDEKEEREDLKIASEPSKLTNSNFTVGAKNSSGDNNLSEILNPQNNYTQSADGVKTEEIPSEEISSEKKKLQETLKGINDAYEAQTDMTFNGIKIPKTEEKVYVMPTEEEIRKIVEDEVSPTYDVQKQNLERENEIATGRLKEEIDEVEEAVKRSIDELRQNYSKAKENASNEALKRGLGRSSIVLNQLQELEKGEISSLEEVLQRGEKSKAEVNDEINEIAQNLMASIRGLDAKKAAEIAKGIRELTDEYEKERDEVLEYNNKQKQEQAKLLADLVKAGVKADEQSSEEYINMISSKVKALYSYYASLGEDASKELEKDKEYIVGEVGESGYENLARYF